MVGAVAQENTANGRYLVVTCDQRACRRIFAELSIYRPPPRQQVEKRNDARKESFIDLFATTGREEME